MTQASTQVLLIEDNPGDADLVRLRLVESNPAVQRMLGPLRVILESMVRRPEQRLREIGLLSTDERRQVSREWNDTAADVPENRCVHHLVEDRAAETPEAIALTFGGEALTEEAQWAKSNHAAWTQSAMLATRSSASLILTNLAGGCVRPSRLRRYRMGRAGAERGRYSQAEPIPAPLRSAPWESAGSCGRAGSGAAAGAG